MKTDLENVFRLNDEHEIFKFCKDYASSNQEFAEMLIERFLPQKDNTFKNQFSDIDKELVLCFGHEKQKSRYEHWGPDLDWNAIGVDLWRLIAKGKYMLNNGFVVEAIYLALEVLRNVCKMYGEDAVYNDQDLDGDYFSTDDAILLLKEAIALQTITRQDLLNIAEELEEIGEFEACKSYGLCDFSSLIESIKKSQLPEEDYVEYLKSEMNRAADYSQSGYAIKLFHFFLEHKRSKEAEDWAKENLKHDRLLDVYVDWLIGEQRLNDALLILDVGINSSESWRHQSSWQMKKLEIYESQHDTERIIEQCRKLFISERDCMIYYRKLKSHINRTKWNCYLDNLLALKEFSGDACDVLSQIYYEEERYAELFEVLNQSKSKLLSALQKYANQLTEEQQTILILKIEKTLIHFAEHQMGRKSYQDLASRLGMLKGCCKVGKIYCKKLVGLFRSNYRNRPAMLDELKKL